MRQLKVYTFHDVKKRPIHIVKLQDEGLKTCQGITVLQTNHKEKAEQFREEMHASLRFLFNIAD